jgi:hypothetical protein
MSLWTLGQFLGYLGKRRIDLLLSYLTLLNRFGLKLDDPPRTDRKSGVERWFAGVRCFLPGDEYHRKKQQIAATRLG